MHVPLQVSTSLIKTDPERCVTVCVRALDLGLRSRAGRRSSTLHVVISSVSRQLQHGRMSSDLHALWRNADCVCFDVDSTVIIEESLNELAKWCGKGAEVTSLTNEAMSGVMPFEDSLRLRLNIIQPSQGQVRDFILKKAPTLTPGIKKLVETLISRGVAVYLVSGGFKSVLLPVANTLNIPAQNVFANRFKFYFNGDFAGHKEDEPTARSGGKAVVVEQLRTTKNYKTIIFIGDGMTDFEASPPADLFIGYGGNVIREAVKKKAKWYITDFNELTDILYQY